MSPAAISINHRLAGHELTVDNMADSQLTGQQSSSQYRTPPAGENNYSYRLTNQCSSLAVISTNVINISQMRNSICLG